MNHYLFAGMERKVGVKAKSIERPVIGICISQLDIAGTVEFLIVPKTTIEVCYLTVNFQRPIKCNNTLSYVSVLNI